MQIKTLTIEEVKSLYSERHGFVFHGASPSDPQKSIFVAQAVKSKGFTDSMPEIVAQLNPQTFCFIYPQNCSFESGPFFQATRHLISMFGIFEIDILKAFLKEN